MLAAPRLTARRPPILNSRAPRLLLQVDSWALGCMAYELLVGRSPFAARNEDKIEDKIHTGA